MHYLGPDEYEDVLAEFVGEAWVMSRRYNPERELSPGETRISFSTWLNRYLEPRLADWYRRRFGDARYGRPPELSSLDPSIDQVEGVDWGWASQDPQSFEEVETAASLQVGAWIGGTAFGKIIESETELADLHKRYAVRSAA